MSKPIPTIQKYMSMTPHTVGKDQPIVSAANIMSEHRIRHLPVLDGGVLVGVVTERDIAMISGLAGVDPEKVRVEEAMSINPFTVEPDARLDQVATEMAERKLGSAVVVQNHKVVGIFTSVDALTALADLLVTRLR